MKILYRLPSNFNTPHEEEVSFSAWGPEYEHDIFMYSDKDDVPVFKEQCKAYTLKRINNNYDRKPPRPGSRRRVDTKARDRKPRVNGAFKALPKKL